MPTDSREAGTCGGASRSRRRGAKAQLGGALMLPEHNRFVVKSQSKMFSSKKPFEIADPSGDQGEDAQGGVQVPHPRPRRGAG